MTKNEQERAAARFQQDWTGRGYEKGESQKFWIDLLCNVFGIQDFASFIQFENQVRLDHTSFIDGYIPSTHVMIEQKSSEKDLNTPVRQSDGSFLTAFQQAKRYAAELPYSQRPRWIVTCNFRSWCIYDMEQPNSEPQVVLLEHFDREYYRLQFMVQQENAHLNREMEVSMKAGEIIGSIYDRLLALYINPTAPETLHSLNMLCVRLVFCLYAEDAGIFGKKQLFGDYLSLFPARQIRQALLRLFEVLDTPIDQRDPYLEDELKAFPYVNGGLFTVQDKAIPQFTDELKQMLIVRASDDFDWSEISPTIFGAIFESTLNPETRRAGGMHYTSIENIHKVIDPLFLNRLNEELDTILSAQATSLRARQNMLADFQHRLGALRFLDPACGSGNFLTETYLSLRRLENRCLQAMLQDQSTMDFFDDRICVSIHQFYGIEINDFAATVAKTALWIAESQMMAETSRILARDLDFLPLKSYSNIIEGNALRTDWCEVLGNTTPIASAAQPLYIIGNPPFVGARWMSKEQKDDLLSVFGSDWKNAGNLDFVCAWYKKASDLIQGTDIHCAFVSTNSICQGESVPDLWRPLMLKGIHIDFAYKTFIWDSEANIKAHVHCIVVGFSAGKNLTAPVLYADDTNQPTTVSHINAYLIDAPDIFIDARSTPLCLVPEIGIGNKPIDDGNYLFSAEEMQSFIEKEPQSKPYFHPYYGAYEFINQKPRYCLWLGDCSPAELRSMPECLRRVEDVRLFRLASKSEGTRKLADRPTRFHVENMPKTHFLVVPQVSSQRRRYIPIGYMNPTVICSDKVRLMPNATLFHFGVLTSNVHMAWMRVVCCRLKSDYSYTINIVYNNFPWCTPTEAQREEIERTAQGILDARAKYPDSSLADLYDEVTMPIELRRAHQANDRAVMRAYGFSTSMSESDCVARLFEMYQLLTHTTNH